jgi:DNA-binding transcriptional MerR regulator
MKIAALSTATGASVATLKYYLREGLLNPGLATAVNQADYDESHVRRVRLVRALVDLGHLSIAEVAEVVAAADDERVPIHDAFGITQDAMAPDRDRDGDLHRQARALVDGFVDRHRLRVRPEAAMRTMLADALVRMAEFGMVDLADPSAEGAAQFDAFATFFKQLAAAELGFVPETHRSEMVEYTVVGTLVIETAMIAIRRLALEDASERRFGNGARS